MDHDALRWILRIQEATVKVVKWRLWIPEFAFEVVQWAGTKPYVADALSGLLMTGMDESWFEADIMVLMITEAHTEGGNTGMDTKTWHRLPFYDDMPKVEPALPEIFPLSDRTVRINSLQHAISWLTRRWIITAGKMCSCMQTGIRRIVWMEGSPRLTS